MRRGPWHQFCDKSQKFAIEQIQNGAGVGVIMSPKDLSYNHAIRYAQEYHNLGAHVLIDMQFYEPNFSNPNISSYPMSEFRLIPSQLQQLGDHDYSDISTHLFNINQQIKSEGLISPALIYQGGRPDLVTLNSALFEAAKKAGDALGIPTYATVIIGSSATSSNQAMNEILSQVTSIKCDGYYYGFEFVPERIPSSVEAVLNCCTAGLTLACTGLPVMHAYAGPMALLSMGFGATGAGVGHYKNVWRFDRSRWGPTSPQGGGGDAPPRYFSSSLWGTIVCPDEIIQLSPAIQSQILTHSPFSALLTAGTAFSNWPNWDSNKHFVYTICSNISNISANLDPRNNANAAITILHGASTLITAVQSTGLTLRDDTTAYQQNWEDTMNTLLVDRSQDYEYLSLLA